MSEQSVITEDSNDGRRPLGPSKVSLEESSEFHFRILDRIPTLLLYVDLQQRCRFANRTFLSWIGGSTDIHGALLGDILEDGRFDLDLARLPAAMSGQLCSFEQAIRHRHGALRHVAVTFHPDEVSGRIDGVLIEVVDITTMKETETALHDQLQARQQAMKLLSQTKLALREAQRVGNMGSWEWQIEPDVVVWSEQLYKLFGRDPRRPPPSFAEHSELYPPEDLARLQAAVEHTLKTLQPHTIELQFIRPDGSFGWLESKCEAEPDKDGRVEKLRGTASDITARRQAQEQQFKMLLGEQADSIQKLALAKLRNDMRPLLEAIDSAKALLQTETDENSASALQAYRLVARKALAFSDGLAGTQKDAVKLAPWQLRRAIQLLSDHLGTGTSIEDIAGACDLSPTHFSRAFKGSVGTSPHRWLMEKRIEEAKNLMRETDLKLSEIASRCGFADQSHLTRCFSASVGKSPAAWRRAFRI